MNKTLVTRLTTLAAALAAAVSLTFAVAAPSMASTAGSVHSWSAPAHHSHRALPQHHF